MNVAQLLMQDQKQQQNTSVPSTQMHPDQLAAFQKQFFNMQQLMSQMAGSNGGAATLPNEMLLAQLLPKFAMDSMPKFGSNEQSPSANSNTKTFSAFGIDALTGGNQTTTPNKRDSSNSDIDTLPEDEPHSPNGITNCLNDHN